MVFALAVGHQSVKGINVIVVVDTAAADDIDYPGMHAVVAETGAVAAACECGYYVGDEELAAPGDGSCDVD